MTENITGKRKLISFLEEMNEDIGLGDIKTEVRIFFRSHRIQKKKVAINVIRRAAFVFSILAAILTIIEMRANVDSSKSVNYIDLFAYAAWAIAPPMWFLCEYVWILPSASKEDEIKFRDFKYTQDLAAKIWGGFLLLITALLYIKYGNLLFGK